MVKNILSSAVVGAIVVALVVLLVGGDTKVEVPTLGATTSHTSSAFDAKGGFSVDGTSVINSSGEISTTKIKSTAGLTEGGVLTIATTSSTYTLTQAQLASAMVISISAMSNAAAMTLTLPATSTLTTLLPSNGDTREWIIDNLHTSAATTTTVTAGTGFDLDGTTANDDVLNGGVSGRLECWRLPNTDVRCIVEEMVDAG